MDQFKAPYGEEIELRQIIHDSGVPLLRVIVRDGEKYHKLELDVGTAHQWGKSMIQWAEKVASEKHSPHETGS